ncbi:Rv3654c family TadE-like protein [Kytococcus sp. Marseille-QA3725]
MSTPQTTPPREGAVVRQDGESGSGAMVAMLIGMVLIALLAAGLTAGQTWRAASNARTAADLSALAATGATSPTAMRPASPCRVAREVAARNGAVLVSCTVRRFDVTVRVSVDSGTPFGPAFSRATAGPKPPDHPRKRGGPRRPSPSPVR